MDAFTLDNFFAEVDNKAVDAGRIEAANPDAPIPEGTRLPVIIERIGYTDDIDTATLNIMWRVAAGPHAPRVVFQKLLLVGQDKYNPEKSENKRKRARTQLMVMIRLTGATKVEEILRGGKLPADSVMSEFMCGKPLEITVGAWEIEGNDGVKRTGNWVKAVGPREAPKAPVVKKAPPASTLDAIVTTGSGYRPERLADDEIPF